MSGIKVHQPTAIVKIVDRNGQWWKKTPFKENAVDEKAMQLSSLSMLEPVINGGTYRWVMQQSVVLQQVKQGTTDDSRMLSSLVIHPDPAAASLDW